MTSRGLGTRSSGEMDREEPVQAVEAFQFHLAALEEVDSRTGDEVVHHVGHQDLAAEGVTRDARRVVNRLAEEMVGLVQRVAGVDSDSDADRRRAVSECSADLALDRLRTCDAPSRARKREHRSVALCLDDGAAMLRGRLRDYDVVSSEEIEPCPVTDAGKQDGRVYDVGEEDRDRALGV